jgi:RHS repeat-associated protein
MLPDRAVVCLRPNLVQLRVWRRAPHQSWGAAIQRLDCNPWGNLIAASSGSDRSTFNDQKRDLETGLYDLSDRNYDPAIGAFPRPDRLWEKFASVSPYGYCNANPVRLTDPDGMQAKGKDKAAMVHGGDYGGGGGSPTDQLGPQDKNQSTGSFFNQTYAGPNGLAGMGVRGAQALQKALSKGASSVSKVKLRTGGTVAEAGGVRSFRSFRAFKAEMGSAGKGKQWHHIVEQCQNAAKSGKGNITSYQINSTLNTVKLDAATHSKVSAYYSSIPGNRMTGGMTLRQWLAGKPFAFQHAIGHQVLQMFGVKTGGK